MTQFFILPIFPSFLSSIPYQDAIWACYKRSLEMGGEDSNVGPGRVPVTPIVFRPSHHPIEAPRGEIVAEVQNASEKDKHTDNRSS